MLVGRIPKMEQLPMMTRPRIWRRGEGPGDKEAGVWNNFSLWMLMFPVLIAGDELESQVQRFKV